MKIKGIASNLVNLLLERSNIIGQGRSVGVIGFVDQNGFISEYGKIIDGGLSGLPFRKLLYGVMEKRVSSLIELINYLPKNAVLISTSPGKTGIITGTGGINIFNLPIVKIGIKNKKVVGVGILYPKDKFFALSSQSEKIQLTSLMAKTMAEEKRAMRESTNLHLRFLEISEELPTADIKAQKLNYSLVKKERKEEKKGKDNLIKGVASNFAEKLIKKSIEVEQGREIAAIGIVNDEGIIESSGEIVVGGMGYVPARMLASSYSDITNISLREAYTKIIPDKAVIVHTHPGGTGVMHMGDAMAVPGIWGRSIVAIGHDEKGKLKGATVIEFSKEICLLADEYEDIEEKFFQVNKATEEAKLRKRRYEIAQEFTDLCREIQVL